MPQVETNSKLKLIPVQHHFLIISCSYALNLALAPAPARFAIINQAPAGFAKTKSSTALVQTPLYCFSDIVSKMVIIIGRECVFSLFTLAFIYHIEIAMTIILIF